MTKTELDPIVPPHFQTTPGSPQERRGGIYFSSPSSFSPIVCFTASSSKSSTTVISPACTHILYTPPSPPPLAPCAPCATSKALLTDVGVATVADTSRELMPRLPPLGDRGMCGRCATAAAAERGVLLLMVGGLEEAEVKEEKAVGTPPVASMKMQMMVMSSVRTSYCFGMNMGRGKLDEAL